MNAELNKLFGRDFIIGFLLPSLLFLLATSWSWSHAGRPLAWLKFSAEEPFKDSAVLAMVAFALAVLLQALNRELFRLLEGYWPLPSQLLDGLTRFQKRKFRELQAKVANLKAEWDKHEKEHCPGPFPYMAELIKLSAQAASRFPAREVWVLPTSFGNTARAYEDYPRIMYGFESIGGWARLQTVISKQAADLLSRVRGRVDLWLNLFFLSWVVMLDHVWLTWHSGKPELLLFVAGGLLFAAIAYDRARSSAGRYGDQVKATYDVFLSDLCEKLGFRLSADPERNRKFWFAFSQAFFHRQPERLSEMAGVGLERSSPKTGKADGPDEQD